MNEIYARREICRIGKSLFDRGYVHATAGNISARLEDGFLITPIDACLGYLEPERIAKVDRNNPQKNGARACHQVNKRESSANLLMSHPRSRARR